MENKTRQAKGNVQGPENDDILKKQNDIVQSQKTGDLEQQIDYNKAKQDFGLNTLRPLNDDNNNRNEEIPEFGADEDILNQHKDDENAEPKNPEVPSEGDHIPKENPIIFN